MVIHDVSRSAVGVEAPALGKDRVLVVFSGLLLAMLLAALDSTIVSTALPTIVGELGGLDRLAWVVTAYLLAQTVVTPLYGKLGDLYGRRIVLQTAIVVFLIGSVLCGMSGSMMQLIVYRFVQGLGGGGLMVTTMAVVADIVPARERGRYQGIFGAVFGVSSVAGPLLGGYFTTHLSWRWIFYVNLPLGVIALAVIAATLPASQRKVRHAIDYLGAGLLAVALSGIVLVSDLGGTAYPWASPLMIGLMVASAVALVAFLAVERSADEPVLPLRLFLNRAFTVASAMGLIVGFALFGSVTYIPLFLQVVKGSSPTESGLQMLPMMGGMLVTSIVSGQLISRTGRYKVFPIVGIGVMTAGLFLLSGVTAATSTPAAAGMMLLLGLGMGMVMQVLVIAVQNAVDFSDLGVATSGATLFRSVGGSVGTAVLGAIFAGRLAANLAGRLPEGQPGSGLGPGALGQLPEATRALYVTAFTDALGTVFLVAAVIAVVGFLLAWLLPEKPLRETVAAASGAMGEEVGQAFAMPTDGESLPHLLRGLAVLADRDVRRRYIEGLVTRAGVDLSPLAAWLLVRYEREPGLDTAALARARGIDPRRLAEAHAELAGRGLIEDRVWGDGRAVWREPTAAGCDILNRLAVARRAKLGELFSDWSPEKREEVADVLRNFARDLVPDSVPGEPAGGHAKRA